jgi:hypothetical protein
MGNFITDTVGKIAGNVTQSVISALIVTAITTYVIVAPGRKDKEGSAAADSAKAATMVAPLDKSDTAHETKSPGERLTEKTTPGKPTGEVSKSSIGDGKAVVMPATETKDAPTRIDPPVTETASKAFKELPVENPTEKKLESTIDQGRARADSLLRAHPPEGKAKEVKKEEKKKTQDVKKRADEVFDELDDDVQK